MAAPAQIGLDIGSTSVRAVETRRTKAGPAVTNFGWAPLPPGVVQGGVIVDDKAVTLALRHLWTAYRFRTREVVLGVTNRQVVVREMAVANLPPKELRKSLPFQVRQVLPLPVEKSLLDFYPLADPGDDKTVRGLLVAAPKEAVLTAVRATEAAGLHVARVDLASFALLRAASRLDEQVEAIVDIGAQATTVVVHADGEPLIVRTIPRGGAEITELIAKRLEIDVDAAEALKCRVGMSTVEGERTAVAEAIREAVRPLLNEVRSSFVYLTTGGQQRRVARLVLSGGGGLLPGLGDALVALLGVEVVMVDPIARLRDERADATHGFPSSSAVSVGLALGAAA